MGATPQVADWNEDGKKDLIVGDRSGYVTLFTNKGTDASPVLTKTGRIRSGSSDIDVGYNSCPVVADWNNDGKKDLLVGTNAGYIHFYKNIGTNENPILNGYTNLQSNGSAINHYRSSPEVADMNGDGMKDLLVGDHYGGVYYYENSGSDADPAFSESVVLKTEQYPINVGVGAIIDVADWDEDGDLDLIVGEDDPVMNLYRNTSTTSVNDRNISVPRQLTLHQNHPNPFNMQTIISYDLPKSGFVHVQIFDVMGRLVRTLVQEMESAGHKQILWDGLTGTGKPVSSGIYIYQLRNGRKLQRRKMIIEK